MRFRSGSCTISACALLALTTMGCASDASKNWKQLEQCLIGEPLGKEENAFLRLRGVRLAESLEATGTPQDWPTRCAQHATDLHASLSDDGAGGMVKRALAEQLGCDPACAFSKEHPLPAADKLWEAASRAEFSADVEVPVTPKPKAPVKSLTAPEWRSLTSAKLLDKRWSSQGELWLLVEGEQGLGFCTVKGAQAKCADVKGQPKFSANAPRGFSSDSSRPILVGVSEASGQSRVGFALTSGTTAPVFGEVEHEAFDGVGFAEKQVQTEEQPSPDKPPPAPEFEIFRVADGKLQAKTTLKLNARVRGPEVIDDWFAYVDRNDDKKTVFKAKALAHAGGVFGGETVEYAAEFPGPFQVCRSKPGAAIGAYVAPVRQLGKAANDKAQISVTLLEGKAWHAPVLHEIPKQVGQYSAWRCGAGWGGFSWLEQQGTALTVTELVCKSSGCKTQKASWSQPDLKNTLLLGYIHDRVLLVYESSAGDVRTRVATLAALPTTKSRLGFENEEFGGVAPMGASLIEGDQTYLALADTELRLLLVDGNGETTPVKP